MASTVGEQEQKQIPIDDVKLLKDVSKDLAKGSGSDSQQSKSVDEICAEMSILGVKPIKDVPRVTIETAENETVSISKPYVFKCPHSETYIILGAAPNVPKEGEEEVDETGLNYRDILFIMSHVGVSRSKAVEAMKANNGDIVSALMDLV